MDIVTHAFVGYVTGSSLGFPFTGTLAAVAPDLVLGLKRKEVPPELYSASHSGLFLLVATVLALVVFGHQCATVVLVALASHLWLDLFTHGPQWGAPILYPFSSRRFSPLGEEWEFFNEIWWIGFVLAVCWCFFMVAVVYEG